MKIKIVPLLLIAGVALGFIPGFAGQGTQQSFLEGKVEYRGTSFSYDKAVASAVKAQTVEASLASAKESAPYDTIYPQHLMFELVGTYLALPESFIKPEIHVYSVSDYEKAFAADPKSARAVTATINRMRQILRTRKLPAKGDLPSLPIPDGTYAFRAHTSFIRFANGVGVGYLTQGQQDEMPVNNQSISYEFQGMTDDGKFYVTAEFPVNTRLLAYDRDKANYGGTVKEAKCYDCPDHRRFVREYQAYAKRMEAQLQRLSPEKFQPSLMSFDELIKSIKITDMR